MVDMIRRAFPGVKPGVSMKQALSAYLLPHASSERIPVHSCVFSVVVCVAVVLAFLHLQRVSNKSLEGNADAVAAWKLVKRLTLAQIDIVRPALAVVSAFSPY
jgi:hypothetical protein